MDLYQVIDGKQRLTTIRRFYQNKLDVKGFILNKGRFKCEKKKWIWENVNVCEQKEFQSYIFNIIFLKGNYWSDGKVADLFYRIQNGVKHSCGELLNSHTDNVTESIREFIKSNHELLKLIKNKWLRRDDYTFIVVLLLRRYQNSWIVSDEQILDNYSQLITKHEEVNCSLK